MLEGKLDSNLVLYMEDYLNICERERERVKAREKEVETGKEGVEKGKGEVEVKGVKRPPRAKRKFWGGEGKERKAAAPRAKGNRI